MNDATGPWESQDSIEEEDGTESRELDIKLSIFEARLSSPVSGPYGSPKHESTKSHPRPGRFSFVRLLSQHSFPEHSNTKRAEHPRNPGLAETTGSRSDQHRGSHWKLDTLPKLVADSAVAFQDRRGRTERHPAGNTLKAMSGHPSEFGNRKDLPTQTFRQLTERQSSRKECCGSCRSSFSG